MVFRSLSMYIIKIVQTSTPNNIAHHTASDGVQAYKDES
jgi:hypothetical protein